MTLFVVSVLTALSLSFVCSLCEAMLLSIDPVRLTSQSRKGVHEATIMLDMKRNISRPIAAILVVNTVANVGGATVAGAAFGDLFGPQWLWAFTVLFTIAVLFGTEILPKVIGVSFAQPVSRIAARPLLFLTRVLTPVLALTELLSRPFQRKGDLRHITTGDIITLASLARSGKIIGLEQENIIVNAVRLSHTLVKDVMVKPDRVQFLRAGTTVEQNLTRIGEAPHTRYPFCTGESLDSAVGIVNVKKLLATRPDEAILERTDAGQPPAYISEDVTLLEAMRLMIRNRQHMMLARDARGRVSGLITIEDINSELLGYETDFVV